jgi:glycine/D-amino acid oxidase-like deaminating enzyme
VESASVVIAGAGVAGISTAFQLAVECQIADVAICDPRSPMTLTSDKSTECYRNWWPSADMVSIMNRSIDMLDDFDRRSNGYFNLNRRGYLYVTTEQTTLDRLVADGERAEMHGAGTLRTGSAIRSAGHAATVDGADLLDRATISRRFPYVTERAIGALHARRAGWMSAQQFGAWMLDEAIAHGARFVSREVCEVIVGAEGVEGVRFDDGASLATRRFVNAGGPLLDRVGGLLGVELPIHSEAHTKVSFKDPQGAVPRDAPMLIYCDGQRLGWTDEERDMLRDVGRDDLAGYLPPFCHGRPEGPPGSTWVVALWEYERKLMDPGWPMSFDDLYPEAVLRGMSTMVPGLVKYLDHLPQPFVDGGYYTKAPDNKPIIGPIGPPGSYVVGGFSGYGIMVAAAAGELAAQHVLGRVDAPYAAAFHPNRFDNPSYLAEVASSDAGQL